MDKLSIIDLYEDTDKNRANKFLNNTESTLNVVIDKKMQTRDLEWIDKMLETIPYIDKIFRSPNRFIINEEEIVKIEKTKKVTVESIKHLSKNTNFIQTYDPSTGEIIPSKLLNVNKEESYNTYENRLIYTLIQNMNDFIKRRKESIINQAENEKAECKNDKKFDYKANSSVDNEKVNISVNFNSCLDNSKINEKKDSTVEILEKIQEVESKISSLTSSEVYKTIDKLHISLVKEPIKKTNVILKNVNFQYAMKLWSYLKDNFDEQLVEDKEFQDYMDDGELKKYIDEAFLLQYLSMKTLDDDQSEKEETKEEIKAILLEQLVDKMLDLDLTLTSEDLKQMIATRYETVKYKKMEALQEIQKIFKTHMEKYLKNI